MKLGTFKVIELRRGGVKTRMSDSSYLDLNTSLLSPGLNQGIKSVPLERVALPPGDPARSRILLISQCVAIYGFGQNNRIAKLQTPRLLFFSPPFLPH